MSYDKALIAHKLQRWDQYITEYHLPQWESIPDFGLYMDQVVLLLERYLSFIPPVNEEKERIVTASAINNYVRLKLMPAPVKKRYYRIHIAYLIMIFTLKQSLTIQHIQKAVPPEMTEEQMRLFYADYVEKFHAVALLFVEQTRESAGSVLDPQTRDSDAAIANLVMKGALVTGFTRILTEKILNLQGADTQEVLEKENRGAQRH